MQDYFAARSRSEAIYTQKRYPCSFFPLVFGNKSPQAVEMQQNASKEVYPKSFLN